MTGGASINVGDIYSDGFFHVNASHTVYAGAVDTTSTSTNSYNVIRFRQGSGSGAPTGLIGTAGSAVGNTAFRSGMNIGTQNSGSLNFIINDGYAGMFDTSGRLLIGTTSTTPAFSTGSGHAFHVGDSSHISHNDGMALMVNRGSGAGGVFGVRLGGNAIGELGTEGGDSLYIQGGAGSGSGLLLHGGAGKILPLRNGSSINATIDLGQDTRKFKDIYLSGTVNASSIASTVTATTQAASDNSTKIATTAYVTTAVSNLVDGAPSALNTLNELAAALDDNANIIDTVLPKSGGTMTGNLIIDDAKLYLNLGANQAPATTDYIFIGGDGLASSDASIYIGNGGGGAGYCYRIYYNGAGSGNLNKLILKSENVGTNVDMLSFTADGVATFNPGELRLVDESGNQPLIRFSENSTNMGSDEAEFNLEYNGAGSGDGNYVAFYSDISGWVGKGSGLNYIPSNGKVAIGRNDPTNKFHVVGDARIEGSLMAGGSAATNVPARPIHVKSAGDAAAIRIEDSTSSNQVYDIVSDYGVGLKFDDYGTGTFVGTRLTIKTDGDLDFHNGDLLNTGGITQTQGYTSNLWKSYAKNTGHTDQMDFFAISDEDTDLSLRRKFERSDTDSNFNKEDDADAPASGVFSVNGPQSFTWGPYIPLDDNSEWIFETWIKHDTGTDNTGNFYAGSQFYNGSKTSLGNNSRSWGANGDAHDSDHTSWRFIRGVMRGGKIRAQSATSTAKYGRHLTLFNYNTTGNKTLFCGFRFYKSKQTVSSLYMIQSLNSGGSYSQDSSFQSTEAAAGHLVIGHDQRIYGNGGDTNTSPQFSFNSDTDTGLAKVSTNGVGLIAGGSRKFYVNSTNAYFQNLSGGVTMDDLFITSEYAAYVNTARYQKYRSSYGGTSAADFEIKSDNNTLPIARITGTGTADILQVYDGTVETFQIKDGGEFNFRSNGDLVLNLYGDLGNASGEATDAKISFFQDGTAHDMLHIGGNNNGDSPNYTGLTGNSAYIIGGTGHSGSVPLYLGTNGEARMIMASNGDTTFYDKLSANSDIQANNGVLVLGTTSSPAGDLRLYDTGNNFLRLRGTAANTFTADMEGTGAIGYLTLNDFHLTLNTGHLKVLNNESHFNKNGNNNVQTAVLTLSSNSTRPLLQFSEGTGTGINTGMSLEYNGQGSGDTNYMAINDVAGSPVFRVYSGGDVLSTGNLQVNGYINPTAIASPDGTQVLWPRNNASVTIGVDSPYESEFPSSSAKLHVHDIVNDAGGVDFGNECHVVISTGVNQTGAQGYQGSLWFGTSDHPAGGTGSGTEAQFVWRNAGIASTSGTADTGNAAATGNLEFYTNNGSSSATKQMEIKAAGGLKIETDQTHEFYSITNGTAMRINATSDAARGQMLSMRATHINGDSYGQGAAWIFSSTEALALVSEGSVVATGNVTAYYSDERLKDFHGKIDNAVDKVKQLNGYYFTENAKAKELGYNNDKVQLGVSAQEVEKVLPEAIEIAPISHSEGVDEDYLTVDYGKLAPVLIEAIKEQQETIDKQNKLINRLEERLNKLEDK